VSETNLIRSRRKVERVTVLGLSGRSEVGLLVRNGQYLPSRVREFLKLLDTAFVPWLAEREERLERQKTTDGRRRNPRNKG
jgi:hypothetical protein